MNSWWTHETAQRARSSVRSKEGEHLPVQAAALGVASAMEDARGETSILIRHLETYASYQYMLATTNAAGSAYGAASQPLLTDVIGPTEASLRGAPRVEAIGSAGFAASWVGMASHCRPLLRWELEMSTAPEFLVSQKFKPRDFQANPSCQPN